MSNPDTLQISERVNSLAKSLTMVDDNSGKVFLEMCKILSAKLSILDHQSKMPVINLFVASFTKISTRISMFTKEESLLIFQASVDALSVFVSGGIVDSIGELSFLDTVAKLFGLLCKLVETFREVPKNIATPLLVSKAYLFVGLPGYKLKMPDDVVTFTEAASENSSSNKPAGNLSTPAKNSTTAAASPGQRVGSGSIKKVRSLYVDPILMGLETMRLRESASSASIEAEASSLVRRNALNFVCLLLQNTTPSSVVTTWPVLLSTNSVRMGTAASSWCVLSMMVQDPSIAVRYMACSVVIELLDDSVKAFLAAAQENQTVVSVASSSVGALSTSFTSYSMQLAFLLREVHRYLMTAALNSNSGNEKCPQMVVHILKALQFLVRVTPYYRLRPGLLTEVFKVSAALLRSKDVDVRVACLTVFGEIIANNSGHPLLELESIVRSCKPPALSSNNSRGNSRAMSFLFDTCPSPTGSLSGSATPLTPGLNSSMNAGDGSAGYQPWILRIAMESAAANSVYSYPVKIESLQLLNALIKSYPSTIFFEAKQLPELFKFVYSGLYASDPVYVAHVCFVLETIGNKLDESIRVGQFSRQIVNDIVLFWGDTLSNHIFRLLQQPIRVDGADKANQCTLKAALLDALSSIGSDVFEQLPANLRILCTTTPVDLANSPDSALFKSLRAAAVRCLGHLVAFNCMQKDVTFVQLCCSIALRHAGSEPACQCAAAWLLKNSLGEDGQDLPLPISTSRRQLLDDLLSTCSKLVLQGPDKAKPHCMSAIWRIVTSSLLSGGDVDVETCCRAIREIVCKVLLGNVKGPVKLQWNAADGVVALFSSDVLVSSLEKQQQNMMSGLVDVCCSCMVQSANFRSRTTMANALCQLALRKVDRFGKQCLTAFVDAFFNARSNIKNPTEFKHVDAFVVSLWLGFVTWLSVAGDDVLLEWLECYTVERLEPIINDCRASLTAPTLTENEQILASFRSAVTRLEALSLQPSAKYLAWAIKNNCNDGSNSPPAAGKFVPLLQ